MDATGRSAPYANGGGYVVISSSSDTAASSLQNLGNDLRREEAIEQLRIVMNENIQLRSKHIYYTQYSFDIRTHECMHIYKMGSGSRQCTLSRIILWVRVLEYGKEQDYTAEIQ